MTKQELVKHILEQKNYKFSMLKDNKPMNAVFIESATDIPAELADYIKFDEKTGEIITRAKETLAAAKAGLGEEWVRCPSPMLIKYEKSDDEELGIGTWPKLNYKETAYLGEDGRWYNNQDLSKAVTVCLISDEMPDFADSSTVSLNKENGKTQCVVNTSWGSTSICEQGQGFLIQYPTGDFNILTSTEESVKEYTAYDYIIEGKDNEPVCRLSELIEEIQKAMQVEIPSPDDALKMKEEANKRIEFENTISKIAAKLKSEKDFNKRAELINEASAAVRESGLGEEAFEIIDKYLKGELLEFLNITKDEIIE